MSEYSEIAELPELFFLQNKYSSSLYLQDFWRMKMLLSFLAVILIS